MEGRNIEALIPHGIDHAAYEALALLRGFCTNNSRYSWHRDAKVATTVRLRVKSAELHYWANGEGKDSNLRYGFHRITTLASRCLKPLSHLSKNFTYSIYFTLR